MDIGAIAGDQPFARVRQRLAKLLNAGEREEVQSLLFMPRLVVVKLVSAVAFYPAWMASARGGGKSTGIIRA
jgi:hypothetical protein